MEPEFLTLGIALIGVYGRHTVMWLTGRKHTR